MPHIFSIQACRIYVRWIRREEGAGHLDPGAQHEASAGRLVQFAGKLSFPSKLHDTYTASILVRVTALPSGARIGFASQPELFVGSGGPSQLTAMRSASTAELSARSGLPAYIEAYIFEDRVSSWGIQDVGSTASPVLASRDRPRGCSHVRTRSFFSDSRLFSRRRLAFNDFLHLPARRLPPAPGEGTWDGLRNSAWWKRPGAPPQADGRQRGSAEASGSSPDPIVYARVNVDPVKEVSDF